MAQSARPPAPEVRLAGVPLGRSRRKTEEHTRLAFEHAAVGMAVLTPAGRFRQVNPALCGILGRPEKDLLGAPWQSVTHPDDVPRAEDTLRRLLSGETDSEILVKRGVHPDGRVVWVQDSLSVARDPGGHPLQLVVLVEDITEQRRAAEDLRLLEARFSTLFRNSPAALAMGTLCTGRILDVNDRWLELFGYRREEVVGREVFELQLWADPGERPAVMDRLLREGIVRDVETRFRRRSGELRDALVSFVRTELPGEREPVSIAAILDVTERRRAEAELRESRERLAALSDRVVNLQETERREMARELHDQIGQFLTGLRFMIEAPRAGGREEMLSVLDELIGRVSDLSTNLRPPMLDELGLLPALLWQVERFEAQTGIQVDFRHANLDRRLPPRVEITAFRIVQEALTNVARHAGVTKARVEVWADAETLGARIEDEGRGFSVEDALARYSSGLAGMRERCRPLGGRLTIDSAPGSGTRLAMTLPLAAGAAVHGARAGA